MEHTKTLQLNTIRSEVLFYFVALVLVYLIPTLSHLFAFPFYYFEPMRIVIILSLVYTGRLNSYILALTLPAFSYLVSGHPIFYKTGLMTGELLLNILIFDLLSNKMKNMFLITFLSIIFSKLIYYLGKYILISYGVLHGSFVASPLIIQLLLSVILGLYVFFIFKKTHSKLVDKKII